MYIGYWTLNKYYYYLGCSEFSRVNILPVKYRPDQIKLNHMFNIVHGSAPEYLKQSINLSRSNRYNTRSGNLSCVMPSVKGFGISIFSTQLVNCGTLYLPTCNILLTNICSTRMLKHIYGRNY